MQFVGGESGAGAEESPVVTRKQDLELSRDRLLAALDAVEPGDIPKISKELRAVNLELEALDASPNADVSFIDDLRTRAARRSAS